MTRAIIGIAQLAVLAAGVALGGCGATDRLADVGKAPALSAITDPTAATGLQAGAECRCPRRSL
jgi:hypothetical protein